MAPVEFYVVVNNIATSVPFQKEQSLTSRIFLDDHLSEDKCVAPVSLSNLPKFISGSARSSYDYSGSVYRAESNEELSENMSSGLVISERRSPCKIKVYRWLSIESDSESVIVCDEPGRQETQFEVDRNNLSLPTSSREAALFSDQPVPRGTLDLAIPHTQAMVQQTQFRIQVCRLNLKCIEQATKSANSTLKSSRLVISADRA